MDKKELEQLNNCLTELRLTVVLKQYPDLAEKAQSESLSYEEYLLSVLETECETRRIRRIDHRLKESRLPLEKNLKTFEMSRIPKKVNQQIKL